MRDLCRPKKTCGPGAMSIKIETDQTLKFKKVEGLYGTAMQTIETDLPLPLLLLFHAVAGNCYQGREDF